MVLPGTWVRVKWDQDIEGVGTVANVAERMTPKVEPPPYIRLISWGISAYGQWRHLHP